jgi:hypothetical protein
LVLLLLTGTVLGAGSVSANKYPWGVPVELLSVTNRALVQPVLEQPTLQRQYPPRRFVGQQRHFEFFLDHIDSCSALAEWTGLIDYRAKALPDGRLYAENTEEAAGYLEQVYCGENQRVYYVQGTQRGAWTARGRGVVLVEFRQVTPTEVEYSGRLLVHVDNPVVAALSKVFFLFVKNAMDRNFAHVMRQPISATGLASDQPVALREYVAQLPAEDWALLAELERLLGVD